MVAPERRPRGMTSVIGNILLVAIAVILSATVTAGVLGGGFTAIDESPPKIATETELIGVNGDTQSVALTLRSGESMRIEQLLVRSTTDVDIDDEPVVPDGSWTSKAEYFAEPVDGSAQIGIGDSWDAGETVYLNGADLRGERMQVVWAPEQIQDQNPGYVNSDSSYVIAEFTVG